MYPSVAFCLLRVWRRLLCAALLVCMATLPVLCQQVDSLRLQSDSLPAVPRTDPAQALPMGVEPREAVGEGSRALQDGARADTTMTYRFKSPAGTYRPYAVHPSPLFQGDYGTGGVMGRMGGGYWVGAGWQETVPGIGRFNAASIGWQRRINDRLQLAVMADVLKTNTARFTGQSFGLSGQLLYQANDRLYFRTFGGVGIFDTFSGWPAYRFGGTVGWDITERFGMEAGAQSYFNSLTGRWEVLPVVSPYYKFDRFKMQIDLGPLLFDIIRGVLEKHRGGARDGGPTIMIDVPGFRH